MKRTKIIRVNLPTLKLHIQVKAKIDSLLTRDEQNKVWDTILDNVSKSCFDNIPYHQVHVTNVSLV